MDDILIILVDLIAVGFGALITLLVTSISDRLKEKKRREEIARLLIGDINAQLG